MMIKHLFPFVLLVVLIASTGVSVWSSERKVDAINALTEEVATLNDLISE
ncbi:MAG: hypothetical protein ACRDC7_19805 [Aeromonas veronii]